MKSAIVNKLMKSF